MINILLRLYWPSVLLWWLCIPVCASTWIWLATSSLAGLAYVISVLSALYAALILSVALWGENEV